jgi:hypothetical protein
MQAPKREVRLQIMMSKDELELVDNWRFMNRLPTRAAAFRELLGRGMAVEHEERLPPRHFENIGARTRH